VASQNLPFSGDLLASKGEQGLSCRDQIACFQEPLCELFRFTIDSGAIAGAQISQNVKAIRVKDFEMPSA
jgi:hypothetical protein